MLSPDHFTSTYVFLNLFLTASQLKKKKKFVETLQFLFECTGHHWSCFWLWGTTTTECTETPSCSTGWEVWVSNSVLGSHSFNCQLWRLHTIIWKPYICRWAGICLLKVYLTLGYQLKTFCVFSSSRIFTENILFMALYKLMMLPASVL